MYYPDLSLYPFEVTSSQEDVPTLCIGWLARKHPYNEGDVPLAFMERLWIFCCNSVFHTLGYHKCPFCRGSSYGAIARRGGKELRLGSGEIRVIGKSAVYAAPDLVYHYVEKHYYRPPGEFVQAVLEGPLPGSPEYELFKRNREWL